MSFQVRRLDGACGSDWGVAFTGIGGFAEPFLTGYLTGRWSQAARADWGILSFLQCLQVDRDRTRESPERMAGTILGNEFGPERVLTGVRWAQVVEKAQIATGNHNFASGEGLRSS